MQILFHLGAHCTDGGLLIRSILRNREVLAREGIGVPGPGRYRELLRDVTTALRGEPASNSSEAMLLEAIRDDDTAERIVLSNENFLCRDAVVLADGMLYPKAHKSAWLRQCFPNHQVEFGVAMRNPATFVPDILRRVDPDGANHGDLLATVSLSRLLWSDVIARIAEHNPGARILAWCHEDTPFTWIEIIRELTASDPYTTLDGEFDMLEQIISPDGMARLKSFLTSRDVSSPTRRRAAIGAFLEAYAIEDAIEEEIDVPGWTDETIEDLTALYDEDVALIARMPGVEVIQP